MDIKRETEKFWDDVYGKQGQKWSGKPNVQLVKMIEAITPGTALDLGCGEGGDAVWLAQKGWRVTATDVSSVALDRSSTLAVKHGVGDSIDFQQHDFAVSFPSGTYNLVSAQFLQSPLEFQRTQVLKKAAQAVASGGLLLVVEHGSAPSWSDHANVHFPTAQETFDSLELDNENWQVGLIDTPERQVAGPDGKESAIVDNVILVRRLAKLN